MHALQSCPLVSKIKVYLRENVFHLARWNPGTGSSASLSRLLCPDGLLCRLQHAFWRENSLMRLLAAGNLVQRVVDP
jgi:hypothetical protein